MVTNLFMQKRRTTEHPSNFEHASRALREAAEGGRVAGGVSSKLFLIPSKDRPAPLLKFSEIFGPTKKLIVVGSGATGSSSEKNDSSSSLNSMHSSLVVRCHACLTSLC